jgi:hypothetical protein
MTSAESPPAVVPVYEDMLKREWDWAIDEGDRCSQGEDSVFKTLWKIAGRLESFDVPYAVVGAMALNVYGSRRVSVDVHIPFTREDLELWHRRRESSVGLVEPWPD